MSNFPIMHPCAWEKMNFNSLVLQCMYQNYTICLYDQYEYFICMNFTNFFANTQNCILFSKTAMKYYFLVIQKYFLSGNFFKITFTKYRSSKLFLLQFVSEIENKHFHGKFLHFSTQVLFISSKKL